MTDLKLYKHFVQKIEPLGKIKRAWFTTFNLDISFFEKYILSAVLGEKPENLRHPVHYESLSAQLASNEADLIPPKADQKTENNPEAKTEVKVFYDYRMLEGSGEKRTTVELYPINPRNFGDQRVNPFAFGVFHPKVILLETQKGEFWLMVSSANLTFGGWSHNREAFFFDKVNTHNLRLLGTFFKGCISPVFADKFAQNGLYQGFDKFRPDTNPRSWEFTSVLNKNGLIELLSDGQQEQKLKVWSPYFAKELKDVIDRLKKQRFTSFALVPAQNKSGKIDITQKDILEDNIITIHQDKLPAEAFDSTVHAKVWLTPNKLAIGSWNMTHAGLGLDNDGKNNIEAGIVLNITPNQYQQIEAAYPTSPIHAPNFSTEAEMNEPEDELPNDSFELSMDVVLDWNKHEVRIEFPDFRSLSTYANAGAKIRLPGLGERLLSDFRPTKSIALGDAYKYFLKDRSYSLIWKKNQVLFRGFLREVGLASRPVNSFENLEDLFKGWVSEKPESRTELHVFGSDAFLDEVEKLQPTNTKAAGSNAWFSTFYAFEAMEARLKEANKEKQKEVRMKALKQIGMVLPGSFKELRALLSKELSTYKADKKNYPSPMYLWFKIEKANAIFEKYNKSLGQREKDAHVAPIKNFAFKEALGVNSKDVKYYQYHSWEKYVQEKLKSEA